MASCSVCGAENSEQARFCQTCGTSLGGMEPGQESRRTVTAVFVDIVGSTALAERLDTETTTRVLDTYFGRMKDIVARHGGALVFVEVKARQDRAFGDAAEAVGYAKRRRMVRLALDYVVEHGIVNCPCRFDVVSIQLESGRPVVEVFENAFDAVR